MAGLNLDFGPDATEGGGNVTEGVWTVVCDSCEVVANTNPGKSDYLRWQFSVTDDGMEGKFWPVNHITSLSPNSRGFLQDFLEQLTGQNWREDGMQLDPKDMPGRVAKAVIYHDSYTDKNGKEKIGAKIKELIRVEGEGKRQTDSQLF